MSGGAMSTAAPKGRKHLCADSLFNLLHGSFANIADDGVDEVEIPLSDALMSAFAMFSLKAPSLLAFDRQRAEGNLNTIYGINPTTLLNEVSREGAFSCARDRHGDDAVACLPRTVGPHPHGRL